MMGAIFVTGMLRLTQDALPPAACLILAALAGMLGGALWAHAGGRAQALWPGERDLRRPGAELHRRQPDRLPGAGAVEARRASAPPAARSRSRRSCGCRRSSRASTSAWPRSRWGWSRSCWCTWRCAARYFGLRLKAIGKNLRSAFLLGVPTDQHMLAAFALVRRAGRAGRLGAGGGNQLAAPALPAHLRRLRLPGASWWCCWRTSTRSGASPSRSSSPRSAWAACSWRCKRSWTPRWAG